MRLITTLCPEDTFKFSHVHKYVYSKFSRGSSIKPAEVCCVLKFGTRRCKENIPAEGCHVPGHLFRKPSNWHSQWTPGDQRKNERFHWSPSACFFFFLFFVLCDCVMRTWGEKRKKPNRQLQTCHNLIVEFAITCCQSKISEYTLSCH